VPARRPHATLTVVERIDPEVDAGLRELTAGFQFPCRIGAPRVFGREGGAGAVGGAHG
jgi:hypothetical protein